MVVKGNHQTLERKLARFFASPTLFEAKLRKAGTHEVGHGRIEERRLVLSTEVPPDYTGFAGVAQVFCLTRHRQHKKSGKNQVQTLYGITSLPQEHAQGKSARLLSLLRGHWHIENKSHYVRDVTIEEDRSQVRCGSLPQVLAAVRNTCIGLLRARGHKNIAAACRFHAAQPHAALALLGIPRTE